MANPEHLEILRRGGDSGVSVPESLLSTRGRWAPIAAGGGLIGLWAANPALYEVKDFVRRVHNKAVSVAWGFVRSDAA